MLRKMIALSFLLVLTGCGSMKPQDFAQKEPRFDVFDYFDGNSHFAFATVMGDNPNRQHHISISGPVNRICHTNLQSCPASPAKSPTSTQTR